MWSSETHSSCKKIVFLHNVQSSAYEQHTDPKILYRGRTFPNCISYSTFTFWSFLPVFSSSGPRIPDLISVCVSSHEGESVQTVPVHPLPSFGLPKVASCGHLWTASLSPISLITKHLTSHQLFVSYFSGSQWERKSRVCFLLYLWKLNGFVTALRPTLGPVGSLS